MQSWLEAQRCCSEAEVGGAGQGPEVVTQTRHNSAYCCSDINELACTGSDPPEVIIKQARSDFDESWIRQGQEEAAANICGTFVVTLQKFGQPLGLDLEAATVGLVVKSVGFGAIRGYNVKEYAAKQVMKHDVIIRVNQMHGAMDMLNLLKTEDLLELVVAHPVQLRCEVQREDANQPLGARLTAHNARSSIVEISELLGVGALCAYNEHVEESERWRAAAGGQRPLEAAVQRNRIHAMDLIAGVNDVKACAGDMVEELQSKKQLRLRVLRIPHQWNHSYKAALESTLDASAALGTGASLGLLLEAGAEVSGPLTSLPPQSREHTEELTLKEASARLATVERELQGLRAVCEAQAAEIAEHREARPPRGALGNERAA